MQCKPKEITILSMSQIILEEKSNGPWFIIRKEKLHEKLKEIFFCPSPRKLILIESQCQFSAGSMAGTNSILKNSNQICVTSNLKN